MKKTGITCMAHVNQCVHSVSSRMLVKRSEPVSSTKTADASQWPRTTVTNAAARKKSIARFLDSGVRRARFLILPIGVEPTTPTGRRAFQPGSNTDPAVVQHGFRTLTGKDRNGHRKGTIMATAQHPASTGAASHHNFDWLWIGLSVILVALVAGGVAWAIFRPAVTVPPLPAEVIGFEYTAEATTGHVAQSGLTGEYFGYSGELYPAAILAPSLMGFAYDHEVTPGHIASLGVAGQYFGNSGELFAEPAAASLSGITLDPNAMWGAEFSDPAELYPAVAAAQIVDAGEAASLFRSIDRSITATNTAMIGGFEDGNEATTGHIASPGVTGQYFGYSGELFPES
jgi:hypothetical protein